MAAWPVRLGSMTRHAEHECGGVGGGGGGGGGDEAFAEKHAWPGYSPGAIAAKHSKPSGS